MKDLSTSNVVRESLKKAMELAEKEEAKKKLQDEFAVFDCRTLPKMSDQKLAAWQARYPSDSPQAIIALQEWNRRLLIEQIKSTRWSAIMGIVGAIAGGIAGAILTAFFTMSLPPQKSDNKIPIQNQTTENKTQQSTEEKNTDKKTDIGQKK